jgi:uncharacterized membrane protein YbaN (DUF454 family)
MEQVYIFIGMVFLWICAIGVFIAFVSYSISFLSKHFGLYKTLIEFAYHRKEFKQYLENKK